MNQIWHIFRKDARHHWPEIAGSLALVVIYAWIEPQEWLRPDGAFAYGPGAIVFALLGQLIVPLVPVSWIFLIVRAVYGESLVGDRQFWVTRPYEWKQLAAAKALFVLVFVCLPFFFLDLFLLAKAGFAPSSFLTALLWLQLIWIVIFFVPISALAAVTRSIPQLLLALLLIVIFVVGIGMLSDAIPNSSFEAYNPAVLLFLIVGTAVAILLLQYSSRKTASSRWLLAALAIAVVLIVVVTPYRTLMARAYPLAATDQFPAHMTLLPSQPPENPQTYGAYRDQVAVKVPLSLSGLTNDSFAVLRGRILTLSNSQGARWDSGWENSREMIFPEKKTFANLNFNVKKEVFDRMKSSPVQAHVVLAFTVYRIKNERQFILPAGEFALADYGLCSVHTGNWNAVNCRVPLRSAESLLVTADMASSTCPFAESQKTAGQFARDFIQGQRPVELGISPVEVRQLNLYPWPDAEHRVPGVCSGTPLTLSNPEENSNVRVELQFDNFSLSDYQQGTGKVVIH